MIPVPSPAELENQHGPGSFQDGVRAERRRLIEDITREIESLRNARAATCFGESKLKSEHHEEALLIVVASLTTSLKGW